jgi:hypothetical protein
MQLAAVFHGPFDIRLTDLPFPQPHSQEILIQVQRAGICGSDADRFIKGSYPWPPGSLCDMNSVAELLLWAGTQPTGKSDSRPSLNPFCTV